MDFVGHQIQFKTLRQELEGRQRVSARGELGRDLHHKSHTAWRWHERVFRELEGVLLQLPVFLEHNLRARTAFAIWKQVRVQKTLLEETGIESCMCTRT